MNTGASAYPLDNHRPETEFHILLKHIPLPLQTTSHDQNKDK